MGADQDTPMYTIRQMIPEHDDS